MATLLYIHSWNPVSNSTVALLFLYFANINFSVISGRQTKPNYEGCSSFLETVSVILLSWKPKHILKKALPLV